MRNLKTFLVCGCGSVAIALGVLACGSSDDSAGVVANPDGGNEASVRIDAGTHNPPADGGSADAGEVVVDVPFCDHLYGGITAYYDRCCNSTELERLDAGIAEAAQIVALCDDQYGGGLTKGRLTLDPTKEAACYAAADANSNQACTSVQNPADFFRSATAEAPIQAACAGLFVGNQAVGDPCATSEECKSGLTCIGYVYTVSDGACQAPPASGQTCGAAENNGGYIDYDAFFGTHPDCVSGFTCEFGQCVTQVADGSACTLSTCVAGDTCVAGTCRAPGNSGDTCGADEDCNVPLYCDTLSDGFPGKCAARNAAGAACDDNGNCLGLCDRPDGGSVGSCIAFCGAP